jgi:hypothetical protein
MAEIVQPRWNGISVSQGTGLIHGAMSEPADLVSCCAFFKIRLLLRFVLDSLDFNLVCPFTGE